MHESVEVPCGQRVHYSADHVAASGKCQIVEDHARDSAACTTAMGGSHE